MLESIKRSDEVDAGNRSDILGDVGFTITDALPLVTDGFVTKDGWRAKTYLTHGLWPLLKTIIGYLLKRYDEVIDIIKRKDDITDEINRYDKEVYD